MEMNRRNNVLARNFSADPDQGETELIVQKSRAHAQDIEARLARARAGRRGPREVKLQDLANLSVSPVLRAIQNWWLRRAERHFLICADVELQRMREAQMNIAYYQKRAAMARSARS